LPQPPEGPAVPVVAPSRPAPGRLPAQLARYPAARLRDALQDLPHPLEAGRLLAGEVGLGDDADEAVTVLDDGDAPDLLALHETGDLLDVRVRRHGADVGVGHVVADAALLLVALGHVPDGDVPVRDDAAQAHVGGVVDDGDDADAGVTHELGGAAPGVVGRDDLALRRPHLARLHVR